MDLRHYILDGHNLVEADLLEWARWFDTANRHVADTLVTPKARVSTVFLGIDHGFGGVPLWFETMVFGGKLDQEQDRYTTWEQAETGHWEMCERVKAAEDADDATNA